MQHASTVAAVVLLGLAGLTSMSMNAVADETPSSQIAVTGSSSSTLRADTAAFNIEVKSTGPTAAAASQETARIAKSVRDALARTDLAPADIRSETVAVGPRWDYSDSRKPRRTAYEATSTISIETKNLRALGSVLDAALTAGATSVSDIDFSSSASDAARNEVLTKAVQAARAEAEVIARANGGRLGRLILMTTPSAGGSRPMYEEIVVTGMRKGAEASIPTEITPPDVQVRASVEGRWQFVPDGAAK